MNDDGQIVAARYQDWKVVFLETAVKPLACGANRSLSSVCRCCSTCAATPSKAQHNSNTYNDWFLDRPFVIVPIQGLAAKFLATMKDYPPSQSPRLLQSEQDRRAVAEFGRQIGSTALRVID